MAEDLEERLDDVHIVFTTGYARPTWGSIRADTPSREGDAPMDDLIPLTAEEDEPDFSALFKRAKARAAELGGADGQLITDLIAAAEHYEIENDALYWQMSDNGELVGTEP